MRVFRALLNHRLTDIDSPDQSEVKACASVLASIDWNLRKPPWVGLLLVKNPSSGKWTVRNEDRKPAIEIGVRILRWQTGLDRLDKDAVSALKSEWYSMLSPMPTEAEVDRAWSLVKDVSEGANV